MRIFLVLAGLALSLAAASQEIYRWVDKNGVVHYSDQPGSPNAELIDVIEPNAYEAPDASRQLSELLHRKGIPHRLDVWGHDVNHDWPWWRKMLPYYIETLGW